MAYFETVGQKLKAARLQSRLTQEQVADYLEIKREQVSYWETGQREISLVSLTRLADLYGMRLEHFISDVQNENTIVSSVFRSKDISDIDLNLLAEAKRFALNLEMLNKLLKEV